MESGTGVPDLRDSVTYPHCPRFSSQVRFLRTVLQDLVAAKPGESSPFTEALSPEGRRRIADSLRRSDGELLDGTGIFPDSPVRIQTLVATNQSNRLFKRFRARSSVLHRAGTLDMAKVHWIRDLAPTGGAAALVAGPVNQSCF